MDVYSVYDWNGQEIGSFDGNFGISEIIRRLNYPKDSLVIKDPQGNLSKNGSKLHQLYQTPKLANYPRILSFRMLS